MNDTSTANHFATTPGALPAEPAAPTAGEAHDDLLGDGASTIAPSAEALMDPMDPMDAADAMHALRQQADAWLQRCRAEVRAHPVSAVALAFLAGMLVDRASRSSSRSRRS